MKIVINSEEIREQKLLKKELCLFGNKTACEEFKLLKDRMTKNGKAFTPFAEYIRDSVLDRL
ncbi:MAG: hypothetical protein LBG67_05400 [Campylobacteraceae bacterium]|nr:hypothetical protein [Campylobacteraceae bacterium]